MQTLYPAPVVILVRPQMGENIGMAARAMANFGLSSLRLVAPRDGWGEETAVYRTAFDTSVGANAIIRKATVFESVDAAVQDLHKVFATTARERDQSKPVLSAEECARETKSRILENQNIGLLFGPERTGLENQDLVLADSLVSFPVSPVYPSLNLAQSVSLVAYEWFKESESKAPPFVSKQMTPPASREMLLAFFEGLQTELEDADYFIPVKKKAIMTRNLRNIFHRMELTEADIKTLRGVVIALSKGRGKRWKQEH